jgi:hypothetical protein
MATKQDVSPVRVMRPFGEISQSFTDIYSVITGRCTFVHRSPSVHLKLWRSVRIGSCPRFILCVFLVITWLLVAIDIDIEHCSFSSCHHWHTILNTSLLACYYIATLVFVQ